MKRGSLKVLKDYFSYFNSYLNKMHRNSIFLGVLLLTIQLAAAQECKPNEFQCNNGRCIPSSFVCDAYNDCGDMSDEPGNRDDCPPCKDGFWKCENGQCIANSTVCDGRYQCDDNSDELDDPEQCPPCAGNRFRCHDGRCILRHFACDGKVDCADGSDEPGIPDLCPPCINGWWRCKNGYCINPSYMCNGANNCGDNSDEIDDETGVCPTCPDNTKACPNSGHCIFKASFCDNIDNCGDWSDETEEECPCSDNETRCPWISPTPPRGMCVPNDLWCDEDGIWDCPDGSDERNCTVRSGHSPFRHH